MINENYFYRFANELTWEYTAFSTFDSLVSAAQTNGYYPSLNVSNPAKKVLADLYDAYMFSIGSNARAYRYNANHN